MVCSLSLRRRAIRFIELSRADRLLLLQSLVLIPAVSILLRILGLQPTLSVLDRLSRRRLRAMRPQSGLLDASAICRVVGTAARHGLFSATCLRQALALWFLLRRRGMAAELRIGVRKNADRLEAHAWVESNGLALDPTGGTDERREAATQFTMFDSSIQCTGG